MRILLDTRLLLWAAGAPDRLSRKARKLLGEPTTTPIYSAASIWEVAIKRSLGREDFRVDPSLLRRRLMENGYEELPITGAHAAVVAGLPPLHRDPFDRLLIAQALHEGLELCTADPALTAYDAPVRLV